MQLTKISFLESRCLSNATFNLLTKVAFTIAWVVILFRLLTIGTGYEALGEIVKSLGCLPAMIMCYEIMLRAYKRQEKLGVIIGGLGVIVNLVAIVGSSANLSAINWVKSLAPYLERIGPDGFFVIITAILVLTVQGYFAFKATTREMLAGKKRLGRETLWIALTDLCLFIPYIADSLLVTQICVGLAVLANITDTVDACIFSGLVNKWLYKNKTSNAKAETLLESTEIE